MLFCLPKYLKEGQISLTVNRPKCQKWILLSKSIIWVLWRKLAPLRCPVVQVCYSPSHFWIIWGHVCLRVPTTCLLSLTSFKKMSYRRRRCSAASCKNPIWSCPVLTCQLSCCRLLLWSWPAFACASWTWACQSTDNEQTYAWEGRWTAHIDEEEQSLIWNTAEREPGHQHSGFLSDFHSQSSNRRGCLPFFSRMSESTRSHMTAAEDYTSNCILGTKWSQGSNCSACLSFSLCLGGIHELADALPVSTVRQIPLTEQLLLTKEEVFPSGVCGEAHLCL